MNKEELKPIDVSKYTITESGNVIKSEEKETTNKELEKRAFAEADKVVIGKGMDRSSVVHLRHLLKNMYVGGAISETKLLSQHILELQADKGRLTDRVKELEHTICTHEYYQNGYKQGKLEESKKSDVKIFEIQGEVELRDVRIYDLNKKVRELEAQIEKLIDFVLSKTECCDVCPITDTCINNEGTCPYAGILAKGEEEVTREWLMQFISKEIKEK